LKKKKMKIHTITRFGLLLLLGHGVALTAMAQRRQDLRFIENTQKDGARRIYTRDNKKLEQPDASDEGRKTEFLKFYIPSSILFAGIEPAAVSKFNVAFGDDQVELKLGKVLGDKEDENLNNSIALKFSAAAPSGSRALFQFDETPKDWGGGVVYTLLTKHAAGYILKSIADSVSGKESNKVYVSRKAQWLNVNATAGRSKRVLFSDERNYTTKHYTNFALQANYNFFYNAWYGSLPCKRHIASLGLGVGHFDNYEDLDDHTLRKGVINTGEGYFAETESVAGKKGTLERKLGLLLSGAIFKPLSRFDALTSVVLGANVNSFGAGTSSHYMNGNAGFYISKRSFEKDDEGNEQLKEDFSFGILADFSNLTSWGATDYFKDNFKVMITAQIPLRFLN
jgi:hypothetical protein